MDHSGIVLLALLIDVVIGDPPQVYRRIPHPVAFFGAWVSHGEARLNRGPGRVRRGGGMLLTLLLVIPLWMAAWSASFLLGWLPLGDIVLALLASTLLAARGLYDHVASVAVALRDNLAAGRVAVGHIVGRDTQRLGRAAVARAAIESAAENFSDAVVAPILWFLLAGLPGLAVYKAINTLDSMIGHRNDRYRDFGRFAARLDDWLNWLPSRCSGGLFYAACWITPGADPDAAWLTMQRDAHRHRSPSAGWPESAVAGALNIALSGPRHYADESADSAASNDAWLGSGRAQLDSDDIDRVLCLYQRAGLVLALLLGAVWLL